MNLNLMLVSIPKIIRGQTGIRDGVHAHGLALQNLIILDGLLPTVLSLQIHLDVDVVLTVLTSKGAVVVPPTDTKVEVDGGTIATLGRRTPHGDHRHQDEHQLELGGVLSIVDALARGACLEAIRHPAAQVEAAVAVGHPVFVNVPPARSIGYQWPRLLMISEQISPRTASNVATTSGTGKKPTGNVM